jgi:hypothetical protein
VLIHPALFPITIRKSAYKKYTMLTLLRLYSYLSYREPYTRWNGVEDIEYRYYSIGACILAVSIFAIVAVTIAFAVASFEPID